jgi:hypothetical protein
MQADDKVYSRFVALCLLPSDMRNVKKAIDASTKTISLDDTSPYVYGDAIAVRDAISSALLRDKGEDGIDSNDAINDLMYTAGRDGFVVALAVHLGPTRVTGADRVSVAQLVDEMRVRLPFDSIHHSQTGALLSFHDYVSRITAGVVAHVREMHQIVRPRPGSVNFSDASYALAALCSVALLPFMVACYFSKMSQVSELTFTVQMYMRVLHRHMIANTILKFRSNEALFGRTAVDPAGAEADAAAAADETDAANDTDSSTVVALTTLEDGIRRSAVHQLTSEELLTQMGIVMNNSRDAKAKYRNLNVATTQLENRVGRVQDYKFRYGVEEAEVREARAVFYAWVVAYTLFLVAASTLVATEKYAYFFILVVVVVAALVTTRFVK